MNQQSLNQLISYNSNLQNMLQNMNAINLNTFPINYSRIAYESYLLQTRNLQLQQLKNLYLQNAQASNKMVFLQENSPQALFRPLETTPINQALNFTNKVGSPPTLNMTPSSVSLVKSPLIGAPMDFSSNPGESLDSNLRKQLEAMINFILCNVNKNTSKDMEDARKLYSHHSMLLQIYDKLIMKYYSAKKCKEDIVRYILRKVFKLLRASFIKKHKVSNKKASLLLCKKYFSSRFEEMEKSGVNIKNDEELLEFIMPYKKNSKNRTMNTNFVGEIFASDEFRLEYERFLAQFDDLLKGDNDKKLKKMVDLLVDCIQNNDLTKFNTFNRLPWLNIWLEDTKNIAVSLMPKKVEASPLKKTKN